MDAEFQIYLDRLREAVKLSDFLRRRMRLERRGREYAGLCPFHREKSPSFFINDEKNFYHCFGCGAHGDAIRFLTEHDRLEFIEAVRLLARETGLPPPPQRTPRSPEQQSVEKIKARLLALLEDATKEFSALLFAPSGADALRYLEEERGLTRETIVSFRLGLASDDGSATIARLRTRGYTDTELQAAGLLRAGEDGRSARGFFFDRILFPIRDTQARVVSFGGRALSPHAKAKYLNGPETAVFRKGSLLFNFDRARIALRGGGTAFVVEGYTDVLALAQAGILSAVAPLGTAFGEDQMRLLWRISDEPVLCFDGDAAGKRAGERASMRALPLLAPGKSLRFATLPTGQDPDALVRAQGAAAFHRLAAEARPLAEVVFHTTARDLDLTTPERQAQFEVELKQHLVAIQNAQVRTAYERDFRDRTWQRFRRSRKPEARRPSRFDTGRGGAPHTAGGGTPPSPARRAHLRAELAGMRPARESRLLAVALRLPRLAEKHAESLARLPEADPALARLRAALLEAVANEPNFDSEGLVCYLEAKGFPASALLSRKPHPHSNLPSSAPLVRKQAMGSQLESRPATATVGAEQDLKQESNRHNDNQNPSSENDSTPIAPNEKELEREFKDLLDLLLAEPNRFLARRRTPARRQGGDG